MTDRSGATPVAARRTHAGPPGAEPRALSGANVTPLRTDEIQELRKELQEALAENESMAKDIDELYNNMQACGKGIIKRKRGGKGVLEDDDVNRQIDKIVKEVMKVVFRHHKFTPPEVLLKWTLKGDKSRCARRMLCSRIRARCEQAGLHFNKIVWARMCKIIVDWLVTRRAFYATCGRKVSFELRHITGSFEFFNVLDNGPVENGVIERETDEQKEKRWNLEAQMFGLGLLPIYGKSAVMKWCEENKSKRFLEWVTASCRAYLLMGMLDKRDRVEEEWEIIQGLKNEDDKKQYTRFKKSSKSVSKSVADRFSIKADNRYTTKRGQQVGFGHHGINDTGVRKFKELLERYEVESKEEKRGIMNAWDEYTENEGLTNLEWKKTKKRKAPEEVASATEHDGEELVLPGDEGYQGDDSWEGVDDEGEEGLRMSTAIATDAEPRESPIEQQHRALEKQYEANMAEDDEEDDDEDDGEIGAAFRKSYGVKA